MNTRIALVCAFSLSAMACQSNRNGKKNSSATVEPKTIASVHKLFAAEIIPVIDGGAYVFTPLDPIWYVRDGQAVRVKYKNGESVTDSIGSYISTAPVPTLDGGAYIYLDEIGLGRLFRDTLYKVTEVNELRVTKGLAESKEKQLSLMLANEIVKNKRGDEEEESEEGTDYSYDEPVDP